MPPRVLDHHPPLIAAALFAALPAAAAAQPAFIEQTVSASSFGDCKGIGDFDGDGLPDVAIGGPVELSWFRAPTWTRTPIATPQVEFTTDMQVADVDNDGDPDLIVPDGNTGALAWYENPRPIGSPTTTPWPRRPIGNHSTYAHDIDVADFDRNGTLDVVSRSSFLCKVWLQVTPGSWTQVTIGAEPGEGIGIGDIDRDGDPDIAMGGVWFECPAEPATAPWPRHPFATGWPDRVGARVAHINTDGRVDIVLAASESTGRMAWFEAPPDPTTNPWVEHEIDPSVDFVHTFQIVDIDGDTHLDIAFAEMAQSARRRVGYYAGNGAGTAWTLRVLSTAGSHNIRVGDLGNDGDLDIVGCNWQGPPITAWINQLNPPQCYPNCDRSTLPPVVNVNDFVCFMSAFAASAPYADCNHDAALNVNDFVCFSQSFAAGCR